MKSKLVSVGTFSLVLPAGERINSIEALLVCADGTNEPIMEVFDGTIGTIATQAVAVGGTGYLVGDTLTLVQGGGSGAQATYTVATTDGLVGEILTAALNAGGTGYTVGDVLTLEQVGGGVQATVEVDTEAAGVITAITLLTGGSGYIVDTGLTVTGGTGSGATIDASTVAVGEIATVTLVSGGSGYVAGSTYATTSSGAGADATITASTATDAGTSIAKMTAFPTDDSHMNFAFPLTVDNGVSVRLSGGTAKGYIYYS